MAKVLISFLGAAADGYKTANYKFRNNKVITSTFIAKALKDYYQIDKLILIGTAHSMWDEVYKDLGEQGSIYDEDTYMHLSDVCKGSSHKKSLLSINDIETIKYRLGKDTQVIIIKYGINDKEIAYNTKQIFQIEKMLEQNDQVYLDITHSFRSLPIYLMNCLIYLKNVCNKNLTIESISYGMLDVSKEFPTGRKMKIGDKEVDELWTPVVELKKILEVQDWIIGAYNFKEFGNTYKIASLLENDASGRYDEVASHIREFADIKNLNYLNMYMNATCQLQQLTRREMLPDMGRMVIVPIFKDFIQQFPNDMRLSKYQIRMSKWHNQRHNYGFALILLVESIISFCCEICGWDPNERDDREEAKKVMKGKFEAFSKNEKLHINSKYFPGEDDKIDTFCNNFEEIKNIRNTIVHNNADLDLKYSTSQLVELINTKIEYFSKYINKSNRKNN